MIAAAFTSTSSTLSMIRSRTIRTFRLRFSNKPWACAVAIDVHPIGEPVFLRDQCWTLPVYEVSLDLSASVMPADFAVPLVASKIDELFGFPVSHVSLHG
jgi:hypothetical protein